MITNANSAKLAATLASARPGFAGLIYTKVGRVVGGVLYQNDTVHDTINHGGLYQGEKGLKARDLDALAKVSDKEILDFIAAKGIHGWKGRGDKAVKVEIDNLHVQAARAKIEASCNKSTTDHVYETLVVNGKSIRGARVYVCTGTDKCKCRNCNPDNERAPLPGTIYLTGLLEHREVIAPAPNGRAPYPKSNPVTVARRLFERNLPSRKFVSYRLEPGTDFILAIDGAKVDKAMAA